jgi:hypothetical protein
MCAPLCGRRDDFFPALRFWTAVYILRLEAATSDSGRRIRSAVEVVGALGGVNPQEIAAKGQSGERNVAHSRSAHC